MNRSLNAAMAALAMAGSVALLAACGSDPAPTSVVVVPNPQPTTAVAPAPTTVVEQPRYTVVPQGSRVICSDGRAPPC